MVLVRACATGGCLKRISEAGWRRCCNSADYPPSFRIVIPTKSAQCQRAAIARALIGGPKVLILDEATSALDVTVQQQIMELLTGLQKNRGLSYLFICHNLALVQMLCDRVLILYDGKIVKQGTPDEVIMTPQSEYTRRLVEAVFE
jgi:peptide/nickel transport system ATP-binding protein